MENKLTILIPSYKRKERLLEVIDNILELKINANIVVLFDSIGDENYKILINKKIANLQIYEQANKGISAARNKLITLSKTNWSFFLDDDDDITKEFADFINSNIEKLENDVYRFSKYIVNNKSIKYDKTPRINRNTFYTALQVSTYLFKTEYLLKNIKFVEGVLSEDIFLAADVFGVKQVTYNLPSIKYYVLNSDSITKNIKWDDYLKTIEYAHLHSVENKKYNGVMFVAFFIAFNRYNAIEKNEFRSVYKKYFNKKYRIFKELPSIYRFRFIYCYIISLIWKKH